MVGGKPWINGRKGAKSTPVFLRTPLPLHLDILTTEHWRPVHGVRSSNMSLLPNTQDLYRLLYNQIIITLKMSTRELLTIFARNTACHDGDKFSSSVNLVNSPDEQIEEDKIVIKSVGWNMFTFQGQK